MPHYCGCGSVIMYSGVKRHLNTKKHKKYAERLASIKDLSKCKDLPNEIWLKIFEYLPPRTLFNCEQSCKGMSELISPKMKFQSRINSLKIPDVWNVSQRGWYVIHIHKKNFKTYMRYINMRPSRLQIVYRRGFMWI